MARTPRATVSKSSGQGVSRLSYQRGRSLAGLDDAPKVSARFSSSSDSRNYGKTDTPKGSMNVSYGDTYEPTDLKDVENMFRGAPAKGPSLKPTKSKGLK